MSEPAEVVASRRPPTLSHMGLYVRDLPRIGSFYSGLFDLKVTDRGRSRVFGHELLFLSADPAHHHQLVLCSGRPASAVFSTVMQISFRVTAIDDLRRISAVAASLGASEIRPVNHGNSLSVYFRDPEGNMVEVYFVTPFHVAQPRGDPLDLSAPDEQLLRETEASCRKAPSFMTGEQWRREFPGRG